MGDIDLSKYSGVFKSETREYLVQLGQYIIDLEKSPQERTILDAIFRNFHTIKGMAGTMGYKHMETVAHSLEDLLSLIRSGTLKVTSALIDVMLEGTDRIEQLLEDPEGRSSEVASLLQRISEIREGEMVPGTDGSVDASSDRKDLYCEIELKEHTAFNGARAVVLIAQVERMADIAGFSPERSAIERGDFDRRFSLVIVPRVPLGVLRDSLLGYSDVRTVSIGEQKRPGAQTGVMKKSDIRVSIKKLDDLQNLLSELVIAKESLKGFVRADEKDNVINETDRIAGIVSALQDEVVKIRMVPIWQVFERFPRVVRDTAKGLGKSVDFDIRGRDIELDRSMLENLSEPLIHLLRNSIYHGIESPEERKALGKPEKGQLIVEARRQRGIVLIKVSDDGRGMDKEKILAKAVEKGMVSAEKGKTLSEREILDFAFVSGFSTSRVVDEVSGRGVGLDVVKTRLRNLGGTFDYKTERTKGTTFVLKVPLTMAIIKAFLINVGEETYAIPLTFVEETFELERQLIRSIHAREMFVLRDEVIPVRRLHDILGIRNGSAKELYPTVIVNAESKKAALITSEFLEQTDIVVKTLPRTHEEIREFAGVTLLSDGKPALILDVPSIV
jgi:two-component system chemotaxis sensor kinase CheA